MCSGTVGNRNDKSLQANHANAQGFSLLEMAIVFVLIGLIVAPGVAMYHQYRIEKDWEETEERVDLISNNIGGFRSVYGRYPCPSPRTAAPGDDAYGHEDCRASAPGTCANGICTYASNVPGELVLVGSVPFKVLNLQESQAYDRHLSRLTYAVTLSQASADSFNLAGGALSINDRNDNTLIDPEHTGHFAVISHGPNKIGAYSKSGAEIIPCAQGSAAERENCDGDTVYVSGGLESDFDDRIEFFTGVFPSEWRISDNDDSVIHLKTASAVALGALVSDDLENESELAVRSFGPDTGNVRAGNRFQVDTLCEYDAETPGECFAPRRIAGGEDGGGLFEEDALGNGMSCYEAGQVVPQYLVGIRDNQPICRDEIFMSCPSGSIITGIDNDGTVRCDTPVPGSCEATNVTTTCGDTRTLSEGTPGSYSSVYSGECRMITDYDENYFETNLAGLDLEQKRTFIEQLNEEDRTIEDCGPTEDRSQIRDTYQCASGEWQHVSAHEKYNWWDGYTSDVTSTSSPWPAETGYSGDDYWNTAYNHDCWCREDYRVWSWECPDDQAGEGHHVYKHVCPQTGHRWRHIYSDYSGCECQDGEAEEVLNCNEYYDTVFPSASGEPAASGLSGEVLATYAVTCNADGEAVRSDEPIRVEAACTCAPDDLEITREACDEGFTNEWSWTLNGVTYNEIGVSYLEYSGGVCPGESGIDGLPHPPEAGVAQTPDVNIPACSCDEDLVQEHVELCPSGQEGLGITYLREWDCTIDNGDGTFGNWEDRDDWELVENNCNSCSWQPPVGSPSLEEFSYGETVGTQCSCGDAPSAFCHDYASGGQYSVWTGCQCVVQVD